MSRKAKNTKKPYTSEEDAFIRKWYKHKTWKQIGRHCGRSESGVRYRATMLGLITPKDSIWDEQEVTKLRVLFGTMPIDELAERLGRSRTSTVNKIYRLGLSAERKICYNERGQKVQRTKGVKLYWSDQMKADLRRMYPNTKNDELAEYFGMGWRTVVRKARELGVEKSPEFLAQRDRKAVRMARIANLAGRNPGMIKPGEHRSPATEFKKKVSNEIQTA